MGRDPDDPADWAGDRRETRAIKGGRGAVVGTGRPKAGQDPDNLADWAGEGLPEARPAKVPPKSGRGVPVKIVNKDGSNGDKVSLASEDKFASEEGDGERDPDKDIAAAARLALGVEWLRPSNEARAAVARPPGAVIVQRALAALHNNTDDEASSAAASNSKAVARATLCDGVELDKEAGFEANWHAKKGGHTREEAGRAIKRKPNHAAHQGGGTCGPQVLTANEEADFEAQAPRKARDPHAEAWLAWLQAGRDHKEAAHAASQRKTNHATHQGGGMRNPKVLTALFGSTVGKNQGKTGQGVSAANFLPAPRKSPYAAHQGSGTPDPPELAPFSSAALYGPPAVAKPQGKTGQGISAAGFLPATGTQYKKEAAIAQGARGPSHRSSLAASAKDEDPPNNAGMAELGKNMLVPSTTAVQLAKWAWKEGAAPGWKGNGAYYRACVEAIMRAPDPLAMALGPEAAGRIYLAMVNGDGSFLVLHNLARFEELAGMRYRAGGRIVAFEGEVRDDFGLPRLLQFNEPDNNLFALDSFPLPALHGAAMFYHQDGENDLRFHNKIVPSSSGGQRYSCLIPVPTEWAPWFLDNPDLGTTFRRLIFLMQEAEQDDRELLRHFAASITYACGFPDPRANCPVSALSSKWRRVTYSKAALHWATAQWEGHAVVNDTVAQRKEPPAPEADVFDCLFGRARTPVGGVPPIHRARGSHCHRTQLASASLSPDKLRGGGSCGSNNPPPSHGCGYV